MYWVQRQQHWETRSTSECQAECGRRGLSLSMAGRGMDMRALRSLLLRHDFGSVKGSAGPSEPHVSLSTRGGGGSGGRVVRDAAPPPSTPELD